MSNQVFTHIRRSQRIFLFIFCAFMIWVHYGSIRSGTGLFDIPNGPYVKYYNNGVIKLLNMGSLFTDALLCLSIVMSLIGKKIDKKLKSFVVYLLFIGIFLIWLELYYGSTFYYGEVRDKQMLPLLVNNFGILGSTIFLRQIFKELEKLPSSIFKKYPLVIAIILNSFLGLAFYKAWSF